MLKFLNRNQEGNEREVRISITSVRGGALVEMDVKQGGSTREENILLTPMDAASFVEQAETSDYKSVMPVGHSAEGAAIGVCARLPRDWFFVGGLGECEISSGKLTAVVPTFVVRAMADALGKMMESLLYPTTGDMEEEFG